MSSPAWWVSQIIFLIPYIQVFELVLFRSNHWHHPFIIYFSNISYVFERLIISACHISTYRFSICVLMYSFLFNSFEFCFSEPHFLSKQMAVLSWWHFCFSRSGYLCYTIIDHLAFLKHILILCQFWIWVVKLYAVIIK